MSISDSFNLVGVSVNIFSRKTTYFKCPHVIYPDAKPEGIYAFQDSCIRYLSVSENHSKFASSQIAYSVASNGLCLCLKDRQQYIPCNTKQKLRYIWELNTIEEMLTSDDEVLKEWGFKLLKDPNLMEKKSV
jgi:hypothetical protein